MPLTPLQRRILRLLAGQRDAESYVAGSVGLFRVGARYSKDIDIFHDRAERVLAAARTDIAVLEREGIAVTWLRQEATICSAMIASGGATTRLDWAADSDYRFFPAVPDADLGFVLHPVDLATNKVSAAVNRREARDTVDLATIHRHILPLGAAIWAHVDKMPGFTPEQVISTLQRTTVYRDDDLAELETDTPISAAALAQTLRDALADAADFVAAMPTEKAGVVFVDRHGRAVQPDPRRLADYTEHRAARRGHWPSSPELQREMLRRLLERP